VWRRSGPLADGVPERRRVPRLGELLLMARADASPMILFDRPPEPEARPTEHAFVPAEVAAQVRAESGKDGRAAQPAAGSP
jgi:hypothetical protein